MPTGSDVRVALGGLRAGLRCRGICLRVAILSWESLYSIQIGGLAVAVTGLAEELAKAGHEVFFFTRRAAGQPQHMTINHVNYHTCVFDPGQNSLAFAHNMSEAMLTGLHHVEKYEGKFDIVHGHDWHVIDALHELKTGGYPVVLTYHATEYGRNGSMFGDWWEFGEISGKEWYGGYIANAVTTVSQCMKNELNWLYNIPFEKIDVVPNGIDPSTFKIEVDPGRVKERYGIHPLAPVVMFIGRLEYQKGPDLLVEAIPKVLEKRWDATFVFSGQGSMKGGLGSRAVDLGVAHATRFLDFVPHWEFLELLNSCDIVCLPSRNEPFGMALLESWAAEKPVVAASVGGLAENIDDFVNGVEVDPNPDSVAWGIDYLLSSPDAMKRVARGGAEKVKEFSWEKATSRLMATYSAALEH